MNAMMNAVINAVIKTGIKTGIIISLTLYRYFIQNITEWLEKVVEPMWVSWFYGIL